MSRELRPPFGEEQVTSFSLDPVYDERAVRELFVSVGPPPGAAAKVEDVTYKLQQITLDFAFDRWTEIQPAVSAAEKQARRLAAACGRVLEIVGATEGEPALETIYPLFRNGGLCAAAAERGEWSGRAAVSNALNAVYLLQRDASRMAEIEAKTKAIKPTQAGRPEEVAVRRLVTALASLYAEAWGREPGISLDPHGPFVRLMLHVANTVKARLGRHSFSFTAESLAQVWNRLPDDEKGKLPELPERLRDG